MISADHAPPRPRRQHAPYFAKDLPDYADKEALRWFNRALCGTCLLIEMDEAPLPLRPGDHYMIRASAEARVMRVAFEPRVEIPGAWQEVKPPPRQMTLPNGKVMTLKGGWARKLRPGFGTGYRALSAEELGRVVLRTPFLFLGDASPFDRVVACRASDGVAFTVADLLAAIVESQRQLRPLRTFAGGVDVRYTGFEGIFPHVDGSWRIGWGS